MNCEFKAHDCEKAEIKVNHFLSNDGSAYFSTININHDDFSIVLFFNSEKDINDFEAKLMEAILTAESA